MNKESSHFATASLLRPWLRKGTARDKGIRNIAVLLVAAILLAGVLFLISVTFFGSREVGTIENIDGIPFPRTDKGISVTEKLAHADIYLREPVFAKSLTLRITAVPHNLTRLAVGVRSDSFWLSYNRIPLLTDPPLQQEAHATLTIPLTDKFQETDRSIDVMFFAEYEGSTPAVDEGVEDRTHWILKDISATVAPSLPSWAQWKDYARAVLLRERAQ